MTGPSGRNPPDDPLLVTPSGKPRARALGIPLAGRPGRWNAITDVPGVEVGYATLVEGESVRTGVTAIHPRGRSEPGDPCVAGYHSQNGNGEMTGISWVDESGTMSGPICITNTHAVGIAHASIVRWTATHHPSLVETWLLPIAGETWDGYLNDINGGHVTEAVGVQALESAATGRIEEGSVGGGTGMNCFEYKGGSGTASRLVDHRETTYTVGVFLQANFGTRSELVVAGLSLGEALADDNPIAEASAAAPGAGSCIAIVITDAPLLSDQCRAIARRVTLGLARTGTIGSHFSGDLFLAVSTSNPGAFTPGSSKLHGMGRGRLDTLSFIPWEFLDAFFGAAVEATEEAVLNALIANDSMVGFRDHRSPALPRDRLVTLLRQAGRID
jgi:L-aminopeptidase/D-esterase-like protein